LSFSLAYFVSELRDRIDKKHFSLYFKQLVTLLIFLFHNYSAILFPSVLLSILNKKYVIIIIILLLDLLLLIIIHRQWKVIQTNGSICYRNVPFIIYIFHNSSKNSWFTQDFALTSKNNIGVTSQMSCHWLHIAGVWYGILIRYTGWKNDTEFFTRLVVFVSLYCIQVIYRYIIKLFSFVKRC